MLFLFKYWKLIGVAVFVISTIGVGSFAYVSHLQSKNAKQAVIIAERDATIREQKVQNLKQAGELVQIKVDAYEETNRRNVINRANSASVREWQNKIKTTNNQRGGGLENALLKKGALTIDVLNRATADSLRQLESATDSAND